MSFLRLAPVPFAVLALSTCSAPMHWRAGPDPWVYRITLVDREELTLQVELDAPLSPGTALDLGSDAAVAYVDPAAAGSKASTAQSDALRWPADAERLRYRVKLGEMARQIRQSETAQRAGDCVLAPLSSFLAAPASLHNSQAVRLELGPGAEGLSFASGLPRSGDSLEFTGRHLRQRSFAVVGSSTQMEVVLQARSGVGGGAQQCHVQVVWPRAGCEEFLEMIRPWIVSTFQRSAQLWNGMPLERMLLALVPSEGRRGVLFGRVYPGQVPTLMLLTGTRTRSLDDLSDDWMLSHETLHLGFPPVTSDARWLDEGLATYYEPMLRAHEGELSEIDLWDYLVRQLPRGVRALTRRGLAHARGIDDVYWGGALFLLLLDLEVRRESLGTRRLSDALRATLDDGIEIGSRAFTLDQLLDHFEGSLGAPVARLRERYVDRESSFDLDALLGELGVLQERGSIQLDDSAPASRWRRALLDP